MVGCLVPADGIRGGALAHTGIRPKPCRRVRGRQTVVTKDPSWCSSTDAGLIPGCGIGVRKNPSSAIHEANLEVSAAVQEDDQKKIRAAR